ncbi:hypothetical protein QBC39DRAFT_145885, partial [Podospora conica]
MSERETNRLESDSNKSSTKGATRSPKSQSRWRSKTPSRPPEIVSECRSATSSSLSAWSSAWSSSSGCRNSFLSWRPLPIRELRGVLGILGRSMGFSNSAWESHGSPRPHHPAPLGESLDGVDGRGPWPDPFSQVPRSPFPRYCTVAARHLAALWQGSSRASRKSNVRGPAVTGSYPYSTSQCTHRVCPKPRNGGSEIKHSEKVLRRKNFRLHHGEVKVTRLCTFFG